MVGKLSSNLVMANIKINSAHIYTAKCLKRRYV